MSGHCSWTSTARRLGALVLLGLGLSVTLAVRADERGDDVTRLLVPGGPVASSVVPLKALVEPGLAEATGEVEIVVQTLDTPLVVAHGEHYKQFGGRMTRNQQREHLSRSHDSLEALLGQIRGMGGRELGRVDRALVAAAVAVDASKIEAIAQLPNVRSVRRVHDYQLHLTETVPYIGAEAVQAAGVDGTGVRVAVLDSGIDYTHSKLGGAGTAADYVAATRTNTAIGARRLHRLLPQRQGHGWLRLRRRDLAQRRPCTRPRSDRHGGQRRHGTHVADIIAGRGRRPAHGRGARRAACTRSRSAAPCRPRAAASRCSRAWTSPSIPNGDGDISDAVDVDQHVAGLALRPDEDDLTRGARQRRARSASSSSPRPATAPTGRTSSSSPSIGARGHQRRPDAGALGRANRS